MKKITSIFLSLFFLMLASGSFAQDQQRDRDRDRLRDHVMLKDGKIVQIQNGEEVQIQNRLQLRNGASVDPDGTYQLRNQKRLQLRDGECLDMDGKRYRNQEQFEKRINAMEKRQMRNKNMNREKPNVGQAGKRGKNN